MRITYSFVFTVTARSEFEIMIYVEVVLMCDVMCDMWYVMCDVWCEE